MFRVTSHKAIHIPHRVALLAGLIALSSWAWTQQASHRNEQGLTLQQELSTAAVQDSGQVLLDIGVLLLLNNNK